MKVAQVAASLARQLTHAAKSDAAIPQGVRDKIGNWVDPDYCYAAGLAHDLGHPPFGHAGEVALQRFCDTFEFEYEDENGEPAEYPMDQLTERSFEGNAQSTRLVAELSFRKDEGTPGLNLTYRSIAAIAKYPWLRNEHPHKFTKLAKKWSFYEDEKHLYDELVSQGYIAVDIEGDRVERVHRWVEAEIMDWADDVSYATHDLEDFFRAGLIPLHQFAEAFITAPAQVDWATTDFDFVNDDEIRACLTYIHRKLHGVAEAEISRLGLASDTADDLLAGAFKAIRQLAPFIPKAPFSGTRQSHIALQEFSSALIKNLMGAARLEYRDSTERLQLSLTPTGVLVAEFFKAINKLFVIESAMLSAAQYGQSSDIASLCESLFDLAVQWIADFEDQRGNRRLPPRLHAYLLSAVQGNQETSNYDYVMIRVIDYVCSLSDFQASKLAQQLKGSSEMGVLAGRWLDF